MVIWLNIYFTTNHLQYYVCFMLNRKIIWVLIDFWYYSLLHKTDNDPYDILRFIIYTLYNIVSFLQFLNWIIDKNNATAGKYFRCLFKVNREVNASFVIGFSNTDRYTISLQFNLFDIIL